VNKVKIVCIMVDCGIFGILTGYLLGCFIMYRHMRIKYFDGKDPEKVRWV